MKTLTQRVTLREMQILEEGDFLYRRCQSTGFVYRVLVYNQAHLLEDNEPATWCIEVQQMQDYRYCALHKKSFFGGGYNWFRTSIAAFYTVSLDSVCLQKLADILEAIDTNSKGYFEQIRVETTPASRAYEEKCATLYDSNGKFIRANVWTDAGYQAARSQDAREVIIF